MIDNPVGVFVAQTNLEAQVVANLLKDAGIEAAAMEDMSPAGMYSLGTLDQIHKPKVFVSKEHLGAAREVIVRYQARSKSPQDSPPISCCYFAEQSAMLVTPGAQRAVRCWSWTKRPAPNPR